MHNYGHGGGGISLCWGSSELAVEMAVATGQRRFAVLGCGVMGLTTARLLQDRGFEATIYVVGASGGKSSLLGATRSSIHDDAHRAGRVSERDRARFSAPLKGQLTILLPQPEVDYIVLNGDYYTFPRSDGIVLGGSRVEAMGRTRSIP